MFWRAIYLGHFFEFSCFFFWIPLSFILCRFSAFLLLCFSCFWSFFASLFFLLFCFFASLYIFLLFCFLLLRFFVCFSDFFDSLLFCFSVFFVSLFFDLYMLCLFCFRCFLFFYLSICFLVVLLDYKFSYNYMTNSTSSTNNKRSKYKRSNENHKRNKRNKNSKRKKNNYDGKGGTQPKLSLCSLGGEALMPTSSCFFCCCVLSFLPVWVSLHWCKDHDVNELVNKLRFHNASIINQNGKSPCKMEGWSSKMVQSIFHISQMACKIRGSISTMQVDVAECWTMAKYHANSVVCFSMFLRFFGLDSFASFLSSWFCKALRASWLYQQQLQQQQ